MNGFEMILPFLKPIEHLILDDSISEVMVNGPDRVFIEKQGFLEQVQGVSLGERSLMVAVKNIARRLGDDISESKPILDSRLPDGSRVAADHSAMQSWGRDVDNPQVQRPTFRDGGFDSGWHARPRPCESSRRLCARTQEHPYQWWYRHRQNHTLIDPRKIHSTRRTRARHRGHRGDSNGAGKPCPVRSRREQNGLPAVAIRDLLKAALRHRPDRIVLGEIRGGEAFDLLQLSEHRALRNAVYYPCELRRARTCAVHQLCFAKRR